MLIKNPSLPSDFFVDSFIGGFDDNVKHFARAFDPKTLSEAVKYARLQEAAIQALKIPEKPRSFTPHKITPQKASLPTPNPTSFKPNIPYNQNTQVTPRTLTSAERAEKLAKGLCFFCDQPYERGHKCNIKKIQLFLIEIPGKDDEELAELVQETDEDLGGKNGRSTTNFYACPQWVPKFSDHESDTALW